MRDDMQRINERVSEMASAEDIVGQLSQKLEASSQGQAETPSAAEIDEQKIADLVKRVTQQESKAEREKSNLTKFAESISDKTNDVEAEIEKAAKANGLGKDFFMSMVKSSPDAALKLMGFEPSQPSKPKPSVNTSALPNTPHSPSPRMSELRTNKDGWQNGTV